MVIDCKKIADEIIEGVKAGVSKYEQSLCLAVIVVGNDPASQVYVRSKENDCKRCGIKTATYRVEQDAGEDYLFDLIETLNEDPSVHGILCQLPLPKGYNTSTVINSISVLKDVDGIRNDNIGSLTQNNASVFYPCTPSGVMKVLSYIGVKLEGKHCVVVGRSNIVGKPMAAMLINAGATVTVCNSKTINLENFTQHADVLIVAAGKSKLITADTIKDGAIVIDVGINRDENGKLCGDVDFENVKEKAGWITPVPGGIGLMTRAMLMVNTLSAFQWQKEYDDWCRFKKEFEAKDND